MKPHPLLFNLLLATSAVGATAAQESAPQSPAENLPPHITRLTYFGERADFSHDGRRVLFLSKTFGDAMEYDRDTGIIRNLTAHYPHHGYTRALYLANGDVLLSGPLEYDTSDPGEARAQCYLSVLAYGRNQPAHSLDVKCSEGPAVSRTRLHIAWTYVSRQFPDRLPEGVSQIHQGDIVYEDGVPKLINRRLALDSRDLPFECSLETQNFRPGNENELTFAAYGYQECEVYALDLSTGEVRAVSDTPGIYVEPEGIYASGEFTLVESDAHHPEGWHYADIYKLPLDGSNQLERVTFFADVPTYRSSNPVVSDDGRFIAFQMGRHGVAAGTGYGIFLYDVEKAAAAQAAR